MSDEESIQSLPGQFTDIYSVSKWVYYISKVFGMAPITITRGPQRQRVVAFSLTGFLYGLVLLLIIVPLTLLGLSKDLYFYISGMTTVRMKNMTSVVVTFCDIVSVMITVVVGVLFSGVKSGQMARLVRQIHEADVYFYTKLPEASLDVFIRTRNAKRYTLYLIFGIYLQLILLFLFDVWVWYTVTKHLPYIYFPIYGLYVLVGVLEIQFVHVVWNLKQRFKQFNEQLMQIALDNDFASSPYLRQQTGTAYNEESFNKTLCTSQVTIIKHLFSAQRSVVFRRRRVGSSPKLRAAPIGVNNQVRRLVSTSGGSMYSSSSRSQWHKQQLLQLENLCNLHADLCETVTTANSAYGFQMMVHVLSLFLHLIITPYFFLLDLLYPVTYGNTDPTFLFLQMTWIFCHVAKLFLIIQPCSATYNEANRTGTLVSKLLNRCCDSNIKKQLETFALQLVHRRVEFSACGFYTLDFPLIASIAGSVTTYLVILIQFQDSDLEKT